MRYNLSPEVTELDSIITTQSSSEEAAGSAFWYVIHTNSRQEDRADYNLKSWGIDTLAPKIRHRRYNQFTGQPIETIKPMFPRYVFAYFDISNLLHRVRNTRGVHSVVGFGDQFVPVDEEIVFAIKSRMGKNDIVDLQEQFKRGDKVVVKSGPLKSFLGVFEREMNDAERVMILLNTLNYQAHALVERELIKKVDPSTSDSVSLAVSGPS